MTDTFITRVEFRNFKALEHFSLALDEVNILVGPNNSGKSTILNAFRVLSAGIRRAYAKNAEKVPGLTDDTYGYFVPTDDLPMSLENVHTNYDTNQKSTVTFTLSNRNSLTLYFVSKTQCVLIPTTIAKSARTASNFRKEFPLNVDFVPVLGPLEHNEPLVEKQTVQRNLASHRAARHFRNYWRYFPEKFEEFAKSLRDTWPGMEISRPEKAGFDIVVMFCQENRIDRELYWAGFGFQIWCQLLTHIVRSKDASLLIVDEPDIYLHPDLQRQLLTILRSAGPRILLATHSTEIISEAEPDEILLIDKTKRSAKRRRDINQVQSAIERLGSRQNITLTHLARTRRILFVEGKDFKILGRFARVLNLPHVANQSGFVVVATEGFSQWPKLQSLEWGFKSTLGESLVMGAIFDRDYFCDEHILEIYETLSQSLTFLHFHQRKELENYLLVPAVLERAMRKRAREVTRQRDEENMELPSIIEILHIITESKRADVQAQYISARLEYFSKSPTHKSTITKEAIRIFDEKWSNINTRMEIVPGKEIFSELNGYLQREYRFSLTSFSVIAEFDKMEVPSDLVRLLRKVEFNFRNVQP